MFPFACNILRIIIVNKYGGIYSDIGWVVNPNISKFFKKFKYILNGNKLDKGIVSHNVIACEKNSRLLTMLLSNVNKDIIHSYYNEHGLSLLELTGPRMLTSVFGSFAYDTDELLLLLCSEETFTGFHNESWKKGKAKFGVNSSLDKLKFEKDIKFLKKF